ncbi:MAG: hypothetical protein R2688_09175 [Fimbriimonadaceae bacterium]
MTGSLPKYDLPGDNADHLKEALSHGIPHNVLNAKFHEKEALIISEAGRKGCDHHRHQHGGSWC